MPVAKLEYLISHAGLCLPKVENLKDLLEGGVQQLGKVRTVELGSPLVGEFDLVLGDVRMLINVDCVLRIQAPRGMMIGGRALGDNVKNLTQKLRFWSRKVSH